MSEQLKPCPFCGSGVEEYQYEIQRYHVGRAERCSVCKVRVGSNWNTRPIEDELRARIAELELEVKLWKDEAGFANTERSILTKQIRRLRGEEPEREGE